ncbi:hypothetical protein BDF14DRAFT_1790832 [Spinellus fusiger]|nr:hypothetical protein BDF14DRAFT_1790832 [Spinellus fusiger]
MKFSLSSAFLFGATLFSCASAAPLNAGPLNLDSPNLPALPAIPSLLSGTPVGSLLSGLNKRTTFPTIGTENLAVQIMASIKAKVHAHVLAQISVQVAAHVHAGVEAHATLLGGIISVKKVKIDAQIKAAIDRLRIQVDADVQALVEPQVYAEPQVFLVKAILGKEVAEKELLLLVAHVIADVQARLQVELKKIHVKLAALIHPHIKAMIDELHVNLPVAQVTVTVNVNVEAIVHPCVDVAIKACATLKAHVSPEAIVRAL